MAKLEDIVKMEFADKRVKEALMDVCEACDNIQGACGLSSIMKEFVAALPYEAIEALAAVNKKINDRDKKEYFLRYHYDGCVNNIKDVKSVKVAGIDVTNDMLIKCNGKRIMLTQEYSSGACDTLALIPQTGRQRCEIATFLHDKKPYGYNVKGHIELERSVHCDAQAGLSTKLIYISQDNISRPIVASLLPFPQKLDTAGVQSNSPLR